MNIRYINLDSYNAQSLLIDVYKFDFNARFLCNYLSKEIRKLNIKGDDTYRMICVRLSDSFSKIDLVYGSCRKDVLLILLHISEKEQLLYNKMMNLTERYEFYLSLLERGYILAAKYRNVPLDALLNLHEKFRKNNYKNEWVWKKKVIKNYGINIVFKCFFTTFDFKLELEVFDRQLKVLLVKGTVMQTGPDELFYDKEFRKLDIQDDRLVIKDFLDRSNFEFNLGELANGIFKVQYTGYQPVVKYNELIKRITW